MVELRAVTKDILEEVLKLNELFLLRYMSIM